MKTRRLTSLAVAGVVAASMGTVVWGAPPKMKMTTEVPAGIATPDKLETRLGTLTSVDGVPDAATAQKAFKEKFDLPFTLLADPEGKVIDAFGVPKLRKVMASRQAYLFKDGKLVWKDESASTDKQAEDVLKAVEEIK